MAPPKLPGWIKFAIKGAKLLPLEQRTALTSTILEEMPDELLSSLVTPELVQGARFAGHFLGGSGEPKEVKISDLQWQDLLSSPATEDWMKMQGVPDYNQGLYGNMDENWGYTSKHTKEKGWEVKQINPIYKESSTPAGHGSIFDLYNVIGATTTIARKPLKGGGYEYKLAEDFDFHVGTDVEQGFASGRSVKQGVSETLVSLFPELLHHHPWGGETEVHPEYGPIRDVSVVQPSQQTPEQKARTPFHKLGVPFEIVSHYTQPRYRKTEDMLIDSMSKEEGIF